MVIHIPSLTFSGIEVIDVDVQVQMEPGIPKFTIVGLADKTIAESKERIRAALSAIGIGFPAKKILVNLAPADLVKEGSHFDLPIAVAIMATLAILPASELSEYLILGELSLDGTILPVSGVLPVAIGANARGKGVICSQTNATEAAWSGNQNIIAPRNLLELVNHFKGTQVLSHPEVKVADIEPNYPDLKDIKGQKIAKRALEVAAAGGHNLLMFGPPGSGKSMLASRMAGILPELSLEEILECSTIASIAGALSDGCLTNLRPFRAPHHTCTAAAMVGGGTGRKVNPGEISLAHNGVLFLDELPEFSSAVLEALRQPLETKEVLISRSGNHIKYPANFQLIAAMNPCRCGYVNDDHKSCGRAPICAVNYQAKISGPILDRFDLHIEVGNTQQDYAYQQVLAGNEEESSSDVAARVRRAHELQKQRYSGYNIRLNCELAGQMLIDYAIPLEEGQKLLNDAAKKFRLSMRAYNRILKVSRTIADLDGSSSIHKIHVAEALSYRQMDYQLKT